MKLFQHHVISTLIATVFVIGALLGFSSAISNVGLDHTAKDKQQLEQALTRAAVACYASEGVYPPSAEYLEEYYGVQINHSLYTVKYEVIASNLMPDITVLENQP